MGHLLKVKNKHKVFNPHKGWGLLTIGFNFDKRGGGSTKKSVLMTTNNVMN